MEDQPITDAQLQGLLIEAQAAGAQLRQCAFLHLAAFHDECQAVIEWRQAEAGIAAARKRLYGKLASLLDRLGSAEPS